ncbi:MAG: hypothetical protein ABFE07_16220 [Armatimonadia bacterium]
MENPQIAARPTSNTIDIVFDGPPDHEAGRFVEVEQDGQSVNVGEWIKRGDGYWALRIPYDRPIELAESRRIVREELGGESHESLSRQLNAALIESDDLRRQLDDAKVSDEIHRNHVEALTSSLRALNDLDEVRADITRTAAVVQALSAALTTQDTGDGILVSLLESARTQEHRLAKLLSRERELMDKSEPEGVDRG